MRVVKRWGLVWRWLVVGLVGSLLVMRYVIDSNSSNKYEGVSEVAGRVSSVPEVMAGGLRFWVGEVWVVTDPFITINYGDEIRLVGKVKSRVIGPGYRQYSMYYPAIFVVDGDEIVGWWWVRGVIYGLRQKLEAVAYKTLPKAEADLIVGVVLGGSRQFSETQKTALLRTGTIHVVAASGFNVAVVAGLVMALVRLAVGRKWLVLGITGLMVGGYVVLAGGSAAVVRAGLMAWLVLGAVGWGRESWVSWTLFLAGVVMLMVWPEYIWDWGFRLSVAATAGLLYLEPGIRRWLGAGKGGSRGVTTGLRLDLSTTLAASVAVLPLLWWQVGRMSLAAPVVNSLILWTVPLLTVGGLLQMGLGLVWLPLGQAVGWFNYLLGWYFWQVVESAAQIPGLMVGWQINWQVMVGLYLLMVAGVIVGRLRYEW